MVPDSTEPPDSTHEATRRAYLGQESGIKSVGQLCYLVAFFSVLGTVEFALFAVGVIPRDDLKKILPSPVLDAFFGVFTVLFAVNTIAQIALGYGLIRLRSWARWTVVGLTILSLIFGTLSSLVLCLGSTSSLLDSLIGFRLDGRVLGVVSLVVGTTFHVLILWPLVGRGASVVFSDSYREVIRQTPDIRARMHWLLKVFLGLLMMLVLGFVGFLLAIYFRIID